MNEKDKLYKFLDEFLEKVDNAKDEYFRDYLKLIIEDEHIEISMDSDLQMNVASLDEKNGVIQTETLTTLQKLVTKYFDDRAATNNLYKSYFS